MIVILHPLQCQTIAEATNANLLAAFAGHVEVLEPPELRVRLRRLAQRIAALNAG